MSFSEPPDSKTMSVKEEISEIIQSYSEYSTIAGILYIFMPDQTKAGKAFWILVIVMMLILGTYWSIVIYQDWESQQVITTVLSTALPISGIEFPTVTICSQGFNYNIFLASFFKLLSSFNDGAAFQKIKKSPIDAAAVYTRVIASTVNITLIYVTDKVLRLWEDVN